MTTKQAEWIEYTGSDEQIAEIINAKHGWVVRLIDDTESEIHEGDIRKEYRSDEVKYYLICNPHPLADMIIRQAQTGQPVWVKSPDWTIDVSQCNGVLTGKSIEGYMTFKTTTPDWNIPNAEYSFTPFEEVKS